MMNLNLKDVLECKRMMVYGNFLMEYTTSLDRVFLNPQDVLYVIQNGHNEFGYVQSLEDLVYLLDKHRCLSKAMSAYDHVTIADYLFNNHINIDMIIKLADKVKCNKFKQFLVEAKETINKYGTYVPEPKMKHYDRRSNNERNLATTFDLIALTEGACRLGVYEDNLYVDVANVICNIVFHNDLESVRYNLNLMYEDYLSDFISDYEYDLIAYCCKVASYILKYSDIGVYGIEVLTRGALDVASREFDKSKCKNTQRTGSIVENIFDRAMYNNNYNDLEYDENAKMTKKKQLTDKEIEDFKKYL
jgi:hypothetical protein